MESHWPFWKYAKYIENFKQPQDTLKKIIYVLHAVNTVPVDVLAPCNAFMMKLVSLIYLGPALEWVKILLMITSHQYNYFMVIFCLGGPHLDSPSLHPVTVKLSAGFLFILTHWGWVTHTCVSKLTIIDSDNGLSPGRRQAIIWTNAGILLIGPSGTDFSDILIKIKTSSLKKCIWKCRLENVGNFVWASIC